jgi:hypothetical protein
MNLSYIFKFINNQINRKKYTHRLAAPGGSLGDAAFVRGEVVVFSVRERACVEVLHERLEQLPLLHLCALETSENIGENALKTLKIYM